MNAIANPPPSSPNLPLRTLVIVGMPGAGKSSIGRRLASRLALPFVDADTEIENAAGMTIPQIFEKLGEAEFRKGEKRVIARLLERTPHVLATGGGAFMDDETRALIREKATSLWLRVDLEVLTDRTARRNDRPLLQGAAPEQILRKLLAEREPVYAEADLTITSDMRPAEETVDRVMQALNDFRSRSAHKSVI